MKLASTFAGFVVDDPVAYFETSDSQKLISRKIRVAKKWLNFHTVEYPQSKFLIRSVLFYNFSHSEKVLSQKEASTFWEVDMWAEAEHVQKSDKIRQTTIIHHPTITIHLGS